jgi:hypothetical protein
VSENSVILRDRDIFEKIKNHLLTQKEQSIMPGETCAYRGVKYEDMARIWQETYHEVCPIKSYSVQDIDDTSELMLKDLLHKLPRTISCAVGCIISDDIYSEDIENIGVYSNTVREAIIRSNPNWLRSKNSFTMLVHLQSIHDENFPENWSKHLDKFTFYNDGNFCDYN